jgi:hypothetical protein
MVPTPTRLVQRLSPHRRCFYFCESVVDDAMTRRCCPQAVVIPLASTSAQPSESIVTVIIVGTDVVYI